ncbi:MAG: hypothetical protein ACI3XI_02950 [Eubacteriales bacterium]
MKKATKAIMAVAGVGTAVGAAAFAVSAYNSSPLKTKRMVKKVKRAMGNVGGMLSAMSQISN